MKPDKDFELEPEEEEEEEEVLVNPNKIFKSQLVIGDIAITSNASLPNCKKIMKDLLKDKTITNYLSFHTKKKLLSIPTGVG